MPPDPPPPGASGGSEAADERSDGQSGFQDEGGENTGLDLFEPAPPQEYTGGVVYGGGGLSFEQNSLHASAVIHDPKDKKSKKKPVPTLDIGFDSPEMKIKKMTPTLDIGLRLMIGD